MSFLDIITLVPKTIGPVKIGCTFEEAHQDELQITEHPVEKGAQINDHAIKLQPEVTIQCGWSNADLAALIGTLESIFTGGACRRRTTSARCTRSCWRCRRRASPSTW